MGRYSFEDSKAFAEVLFMVDLNQTMKELVGVDAHEFQIVDINYASFIALAIVIFFIGLLIFRLYRYWIDRRLVKHGDKGIRPNNSRD